MKVKLQANKNQKSSSAYTSILNLIALARTSHKFKFNKLKWDKHIFRSATWYEQTMCLIRFLQTLAHLFVKPHVVDNALEISFP